MTFNKKQDPQDRGRHARFVGVSNLEDLPDPHKLMPPKHSPDDDRPTRWVRYDEAYKVMLQEVRKVPLLTSPRRGEGAESWVTNHNVIRLSLGDGIVGAPQFQFDLRDRPIKLVTRVNYQLMGSMLLSVPWGASEQVNMLVWWFAHHHTINQAPVHLLGTSQEATLVRLASV